MTEIRQARTEDVDALVDMFQKLTDHVARVSDDVYLTSIESTAAETHQKAFTESVVSSNSIVLIAENKHQTIGFLNGHLTRPFTSSAIIQRIGYIENCYVDSSSRQSGVGKQLLAEAEEWFKQNSVSYIDLHYMTQNAGAAAAWGKMGFVPYRVAARKTIS